MLPSRARLIGLLLAALAGHAAAARAQAPAGSDRLSAQAVVESLAVLKTLKDRVAVHYGDPAAWFHQGMIAWSLYERCRYRPAVAALDCTRPRLLADTALMIAGELDPNNAEYSRALAEFLLSSDATFRRESTYLDRMFRATLDRLRRVSDPIAHADGAIDAGRLYWLRYDVEAHRYWETASTYEVSQYVKFKLPDSAKRDVDGGFRSRDAMEKARHILDGKLQAAAKDEYGGESDYLRAEQLFREAFEAAPTYLRAYRNLAMLLAERNRWPELGALADRRRALVPSDAWAWMTSALAAYRLGDRPRAAAAFDTGQRLLSETDRRRMLRIERLLSDREREAFDRDTAGFVASYWALAVPLWSRPDEDPRLEFLARVTYAELLWSSPETGQHGIDSDRGAASARFGPPDRIASMRRDAVNVHTGAIGWDYDYPEIHLRFDRIPRYETDAFADAIIIRSGPTATWNNLVHGRIDSIPAQVARFRGGSDSIDVYFATQPPIEAIRRSAEVRGPVRTDFWLTTDRLAPIARDSILADTAGVRAFTRRVTPGAYVYRSEATAPGSRIAARATSRVVVRDDSATGFTTNGFGVSDILLATRATARNGAPVRWSDLNVQPLLGSIAQNAQLSLVWETYGLAAITGQATYDVVIAVQPDRPPRPGTPPGIAARIVGGLTGALGIGRRAIDDRVEFTFQRVAPARPAMVDDIAISLSGTRPGAYRITVRVTDRATGASATGIRRATVTP